MFDRITVPQRLSYKEFLSAVLFIFASSKRLRIYIIFLVLLMSSSQLLGYLTVPNSSFNILNVLLLFVKVLGCMALGGIMVVTIMTLVMYRTQPHVFINVSYEFTGWGVTRDGERTAFSKPWREITKYRESKQFFVIYAGVDPHVIQKSMLGNEEKIDNFRTMLRVNVSKK